MERRETGFSGGVEEQLDEWPDLQVPVGVRGLVRQG
jgi:hypothetical protein